MLHASISEDDMEPAGAGGGGGKFEEDARMQTNRHSTNGATAGASNREAEQGRVAH